MLDTDAAIILRFISIIIRTMCQHMYFSEVYPLRVAYMHGRVLGACATGLFVAAYKFV